MIFLHLWRMMKAVLRWLSLVEMDVPEVNGKDQRFQELSR
jgi:hypothetical protein